MNDNIFEIEATSQAPARISLAGGGTDISPYPEQFGGEVVNATISIFMLARLRLHPDPRVIIHANTRPEPMIYESFDRMKFDGRLDFIKAAARTLYNLDHGFELYVYSSLPMRSGLGGSGAMCVAVLEAFNALANGHRLNHYKLAELAYEIETDQLQNASGRQDQYASAFGGFNHFEFLGGNHVRVSRIDIGRAEERILNQAMILLWIGERCASGRIIEDQTNGVRGGRSGRRYATGRGRRYARSIAESRHQRRRTDARSVEYEKKIPQAHQQSSDRRDIWEIDQGGHDRRKDNRRWWRGASARMLPYRKTRCCARRSGCDGP